MLATLERATLVVEQPQKDARNKAAEMFPLRNALARMDIRPFTENGVREYKRAVREQYAKTFGAIFLKIQKKVFASITLFFLACVVLSAVMFVVQAFSKLVPLTEDWFFLTMSSSMILSVFLMGLFYALTLRAKLAYWRWQSKLYQKHRWQVGALHGAIPADVCTMIAEVKMQVTTKKFKPVFLVESFGPDPLLWVCTENHDLKEGEKWCKEIYCIAAWGEPNFMVKRKN